MYRHPFVISLLYHTGIIMAMFQQKFRTYLLQLIQNTPHSVNILQSRRKQHLCLFEQKIIFQNVLHFKYNGNKIINSTSQGILYLL